jgi:hypothetical protein
MAKRHNSIILCGHIILGMKPPQIFGMTPPMDSERIGRRLSRRPWLRWSSMGKAAQRLNTTQPVVSRTMMRSACASSIAAGKGSSHPRGRALLHCAAAIFDDLRQGVRNIEFFTDPASGEIKAGTNEAFIAGQWRGAKSIRLE